MSKLGDICRFQSGGTPAKANPDYFNGNIPWITTTALNGSKIDEKDAVDWITETAINETAAKIVPANSIMVGTRVGVGKVAINTVNMSTSQDIISLLNIDDKTWNKEYLCKYIQGKSAYLNSQARGATIKGIKIDILSDLEVPDLGYDQQKSISEILDKALTVINARKQELQKLDEFIRARFVEMFGTINNPHEGCRIQSIQEVCEPIKDGTHQTPEYTDDKNNGYLFLSSKDVTSGYIDWDHPKYIPEYLHNELYSRVAPHKGDILLAKNGTTGIAAVVDRNEVFDIYVSLAWLRPIDVNSVFLWGAINNEDTKRQFNSSLKGIGVPNLHLGEIKKTKIIIADKKRQQEYANFVAQVDKSKDRFKRLTAA